MSTRNELVADLLMGAAYADRKLDGREFDVVKKLLADLMSVEEVSADIERRLDGFDPAVFDPSATIAELGLTSDDDKLRLVELIAVVTEADEEIDFDENEYLESVARALELPRNTYSGFTLEVESVEEIKSSAARLLKPPPIPPAAKK